MTDLDLERLGDLWRQQPDPKELEELRRSAEAARKRARLAQVVDFLSALVVAAVVIVLVANNPEVETLVVGGGAIVVLLYSQIRQRRLRAVEIKSLTGTAEDMLDQSIARLEATQRRIRFQLFGFVPAFLLGLGFAYMADARAAEAILGWMRSDLTPRLLTLAAAAVIVGWLALHSVRLLKRSRKELERLISLRNAFRQERESSLRDS
jgi:hypothetical protein